MSIKPISAKYSSFQADHKPSRLFVTGLSKETSLQSIHAYFSTFGSVQASLLRKDSGRPGTSYGSCCLLATALQIVAQSIVSHREHFLEGRLLHVSIYLEGEALQAHNDKINKRRIVVKGIPPGLPLEELKENLEARFGKTESVYYFKQSPTSRTLRRSGCSARLLTASVVLCSSQSARQAANVGKVLVAGHLLAIQEFQRGFKKSPTFSAKTEADSTGSVRSPNDLSEKPTSKHSERGGRQHAQASKCSSRPLVSKTAEASGNQLSVLHSMKPSKNSYYRLRFADNLATGSKGQADPNLRFNKSRPL